MSYLDPKGRNAGKCPLCQELLSDDEEFLADFVLEDDQKNFYSEPGRVCESCYETIRQHSENFSMDDVDKDYMDELRSNNHFDYYMRHGRLPDHCYLESFQNAGLTVFSMKEFMALNLDDIVPIIVPVSIINNKDDYGAVLYCESKYEPYITKHWKHVDHCVRCNSEYPIDTTEKEARIQADTLNQHLCPGCYMDIGLHRKPERFLPIECNCGTTHFIDRSLDPNYLFSDSVLQKKPCKDCLIEESVIEIYYNEDMKAIFDLTEQGITYVLMVRDEVDTNYGIGAGTTEWVIWKTSEEIFDDVHLAVKSAQAEVNF